MAPQDREEYIVFADQLVEQICATNWGDGVGITPSQAARVTGIGTEFAGQAITSFKELLYFTGLTTLVGGAFKNCTSLTTIGIPENITSAASNAFQSATSITSIYIKDLNKYLDISWASKTAHPFYGSKGGTLYLNDVAVTSVSIPSTFSAIKYSALYGCQSVTSVTIPNTVTSIGSDAFSYCTGMTSITIPNTVTSVGSGAFSYCGALVNLTIPCNCNADIWQEAGDGTGTLTVNGNVTFGDARIYLKFKHVVVNGNVLNTATSSTKINWSFRGSTPTSIRISGNVTTNTPSTNGYFYTTSTVIEFIEIGGSITNYGSNPIVSNSRYVSGAIIHLGYSGVAIAPSFLRVNNSNLSKVYVDSQAVLDQYLADSDWAAYASKLDLWSNYNGDYKN